MNSESEGKQIIAAIFGIVEGMGEMKIGPSNWMKDVIKVIDMVRMPGEVSAKKNLDKH